jgi:hypothetical protein
LTGVAVFWNFSSTERIISDDDQNFMGPIILTFMQLFPLLIVFKALRIFFVDLESWIF